MVTNDLTQEIRTAFAALKHAVLRGKHAHAHFLDAMEAAFAQRRQQIEAEYQRMYDQAHAAQQSQLTAAHGAFTLAAQHICEQIEDQAHAFPWVVASWQDPVWEAYEPSGGAPVPSCLRIGYLALPNAEAIPPLPAMARLVGDGHLYLLAEHATRPAAVRLLQSLLLRLIVSATPGAVRLILVDPFSAGSSLALFRTLPDELRGAKIWSSQQEIETQLRYLAGHIESVIQTRLISPEATIERYNRERPEQQVPYQIIALADFPAGFSDRMVELLISIARNGPRAGVYLIASINPTHPMPRDFSLDLLTTLGTTLRFTTPNQLEWDDPLFAAYPVVPDALPPAEQVDRLLAGLAEAAARAAVNLSFSRIALPAWEHWQGSTLEGMSVPIGLTSAGAPHDLQLGQDPGVIHHGLIGGASGSGKGNLLHVLITQLALRYPPEELELYLLDFKEGVEFQRYMRLPHARAVALESEREFGLNVLRHVQERMEERGRLYKSAGPTISKLADYRRVTQKPLPRLLLIIDEFQVLFKEDDAVARDVAQILEDLAKRGRSAAIHVLLCSQSPSTGGPLLTRVYDQMGLRIALQCRVRDALAILGEGNDAAAHLTRVGEAIYNDQMGERDKNHVIRVAFLGDQEQQQALDAICERAGKKDYPAPITFDGHSLAQLGNNAVLQYHLLASIWLAPETSPTVWLGEPIDMKAPTAATLERYTRSNMLIVGEHEAYAHGLLLATILSLAAQQAPSEAAFFVAEFARTDNPFAHFFTQLKGSADTAALPHPLTVAGPRDVGEMLNTLLAVLKERLAGNSPPTPRLYLCIAGMQRWRELRGPDSITQSETAKKLTQLAEDGPDLGIHLVAWADNLAIVEGAFKRGGFKHFDLRVALRMSMRDSTELLNVGAAATLEDNRAYFRHEDWALGKREKFKPYTIPTSEELHRILSNISAKAGQAGEESGQAPKLEEH